MEFSLFISYIFHLSYKNSISNWEIWSLIWAKFLTFVRRKLATTTPNDAKFFHFRFLTIFFSFIRVYHSLFVPLSDCSNTFSWQCRKKTVTSTHNEYIFISLSSCNGTTTTTNKQNPNNTSNMYEKYLKPRAQKILHRSIDRLARRQRAFAPKNANLHFEILEASFEML